MQGPKHFSKQDQQFHRSVYAYYDAYGRHELPWRKTTNPYRILVSEIMLQQTQVDRVLPKYRAFLQQFPNVYALAQAPLKDVLICWQGLGYNRRAKLLWQCAQMIVTHHRGRFPRTVESLRSLPGIGPYTAGAIMAFAYDQSVPLIETNVRTVYLHHYFQDATDVTDAEIMSIIARTLDRDQPRVWYWALMDYGAYIKKTVGNLNSKSKHYTKQSSFMGSDRQIRGAIVRLLAGTPAALSRTKIHGQLPQFTDLRLDAQLERLCTEGIVTCVRGQYRLPE